MAVGWQPPPERCCSAPAFSDAQDALSAASCISASVRERPLNLDYVDVQSQVSTKNAATTVL